MAHFVLPAFKILLLTESLKWNGFFFYFIIKDEDYSHSVFKHLITGNIRVLVPIVWYDTTCSVSTSLYVCSLQWVHCKKCQYFMLICFRIVYWFLLLEDYFIPSLSEKNFHWTRKQNFKSLNLLKIKINVTYKIIKVTFS